jgi:hypothetical protein
MVSLLTLILGSGSLCLPAPRESIVSRFDVVDAASGTVAADEFRRGLEVSLGSGTAPVVQQVSCV